MGDANVLKYAGNASRDKEISNGEMKNHYRFTRASRKKFFPGKVLKSLIRSFYGSASLVNDETLSCFISLDLQFYRRSWVRLHNNVWRITMADTRNYVDRILRQKKFKINILFTFSYTRFIFPVVCELSYFLCFQNWNHFYRYTTIVSLIVRL